MTRMFAIALGLTVASYGSAADPADKKEAELKWAKEVAADFLNAGLAQKFAAAEVLLTDDFRKTAKAGNVSPTHDIYLVATQSADPFSWSISREEIAPDRDEAAFRGVIKTKGLRAELSVRVIKEKEGGKWRVSYYRIDPLKPAKEDPKK